MSDVLGIRVVRVRPGEWGWVSKILQQRINRGIYLEQNFFFDDTLVSFINNGRKCHYCTVNFSKVESEAKDFVEDTWLLDCREVLEINNVILIIRGGQCWLEEVCVIFQFWHVYFGFIRVDFPYNVPPERIACFVRVKPRKRERDGVGV